MTLIKSTIKYLASCWSSGSIFYFRRICNMVNLPVHIIQYFRWHDFVIISSLIRMYLEYSWLQLVPNADLLHWSLACCLVSQNVTAKRLALRLLILGTPASDVDQEAGYPEWSFTWFINSLQVNARIVPHIIHHRWLPHDFLVIIH